MRLEYFQLVDRVVELSLADRTIRAEALVPESSTIFEGHFPGNPLMPGVLLVEAMAQTCGWLLLAITKFEHMVFLAQIKEAKLRDFVAPGRALSIEGRVVHEGSGFAIATARIIADAKPVCEVELMFRMLPFPSPDMRGKMLERARQIELPVGAIVDD